MTGVDISRLSPAERLDLLDEIWDSLEGNQDAVPLTPAQREELDHRLDALDQDGPSGRSWEEVVSRLQQREK